MVIAAPVAVAAALCRLLSTYVLGIAIAIPVAIVVAAAPAIEVGAISCCCCFAFGIGCAFFSSSNSMNRFG